MVPVTVAAWAVTMDSPIIATNRHISVRSLGRILLIGFLSLQHKGQQSFSVSLCRSIYLRSSVVGRGLQ